MEYPDTDMVAVEYGDGSTERVHMLELLCALCFRDRKPVGYTTEPGTRLTHLQGIADQLLKRRGDERG